MLKHKFELLIKQNVLMIFIFDQYLDFLIVIPNYQKLFLTILVSCFYPF